MAIDVGADAPDFTLKTQGNEDWTLSAHRGKNVVLMWYPLDFSGTCTSEHCMLSTEPILDRDDAIVVGISRDSVHSHREFKAARAITHDLLADPDLSVTKKYGLVHPNGWMSHRATVIVDREGKVAFTQVQDQTGQARDWRAVQDALAAL